MYAIDIDTYTIGSDSLVEALEVHSTYELPIT